MASLRVGLYGADRVAGVVSGGSVVVVSGIWFGVLGPLSVLDGDRDRTPRPAKVRTLLALLLVQVGDAVPLTVLIDEMWGEDPPATVTTALQVYVSQLRRLLGPGVAARDPAQLLQTHRPGYRLQIAPEQCDLHRFRTLADRGAASLADGDATAAADTLGAALALWRGPALVDVSARILHDLHAPTLEDQRLAVIEQHAEARLALGRADAVAAQLAGPVAAYPLRERLAAQLMVALYRSGRRGDALRAYDRTRRTLADELGIDPGAELRALHESILSGTEPLSGDPVAVSRPPATVEPGPYTAPAQLPPAISDFTGRETTVDAVVDALTSDGEAGSAPACCEITGPGGAGKTALAVQAAHRIQERFSDGHLVTNLRGTTEHPAEPGEVLSSFLRELSLDGRFVPDSVDERSRLFRSRVAGRKMLVVLDDAVSEVQVRPLLPGTPGCAVLITGRTQLLGLEGVRTIQLDPLAPDDAAGLLLRLVGADRVAAEPDAAADIVLHCGYLPLAVRIAGARLSAKPHWNLADFATALADERRRLDMLTAGDLEVRASIGLSYRACRAEDRRALRLLGRLRLPDFPAWTVAALIDTDVRAGTEVVERLVDAQLVHVTGIDRVGQVRYHLHDLVRLFADEQADADPPAEWNRGLERVAEALAELLERAERAVHPGRLLTTAGREAPWSVDDGVAATVDTDPIGWSTTELPTLIGALQRSHAASLWSLTVRLADRITWLVDVRSDWTGWRLAQELGLDAARRSGDRRGEAAALSRRADLEWDLGWAGRAVADYARARCLHRRLSDRHGEALAALGLAAVYADRGPLRRATALLASAAPVLAEFGDRRGRAQLLRHRGLMHRDRGKFDDADRCLESAAKIFHELGDRRWRAYVLRSLVGVRRQQGRLDEAQALGESCLVSFRAVSDRRWESYALLSLAEIDLDRERWTSAGDRFRHCVDLFEEVGDQRAAARALCSFGEVRRAEGRLAEAMELIRRGMAVFTEIDEPRGMALAGLALGRVHADAGQHEAAACCFSGAADRFARIGLTDRAGEALAELRRVPGAAGTQGVSIFSAD